MSVCCQFKNVYYLIIISNLMTNKTVNQVVNMDLMTEISVGLEKDLKCFVKMYNKQK